MNTEHATPELFAALAKAQAEVENATKGSVNPHFKSKYADLAEVLNTVRPTFAKHGLALLQSTAFEGSLVEVTTVIGHSAGGFVSSVASCVPAKTDAQGIGAATTYLRRYGLAAMTGVAQEDDDGQSAAHDREPLPVSAAAEGPKQLVNVSREAEKQMRGEVDACATVAELKRLWNTPGFQSEVNKLHRTYREGIIELFNERIAFLTETPATIPSKRGEPPDFTKLEPNTIQEPA